MQQKISIAHIVNPVIVPQSSDLYIAQPITFDTLRLAKQQAGDSLDVQQYAAFYPEDESFIPQNLIPTRPLDQSVLDFDSVYNRRKLPLIKDILQRLYDESDAEYLVYTNVDISLMPNFYLAVAELIQEGYDGFIINRRTIFPEDKHLNHLPLLFAEVGNSHPGMDCFVFKRSLFPQFHLGNVTVGARFIGIALQMNLLAYAEKYGFFKDLHLTFHIGDDRIWVKAPLAGLHNLDEYEQSVTNILENPDQILNQEEFYETHTGFQKVKQLFFEAIESDHTGLLLKILISTSRLLGKMTTGVNYLAKKKDNGMAHFLRYCDKVIFDCRKSLLSHQAKHPEVKKRI